MAWGVRVSTPARDFYSRYQSGAAGVLPVRQSNQEADGPAGQRFPLGRRRRMAAAGSRGAGVDYFLPLAFLAGVFLAGFFSGAGFEEASALLAFLPPKTESQPAANLGFEPRRVMVTNDSLRGRMNGGDAAGASPLRR